MAGPLRKGLFFPASLTNFLLLRYNLYIPCQIIRLKKSSSVHNRPSAPTPLTNRTPHVLYFNYQYLKQCWGSRQFCGSGSGFQNSVSGSGSCLNLTHNRKISGKFYFFFIFFSQKVHTRFLLEDHVI